MSIASGAPGTGRYFYGWWIVFATATIVFFTGGTFFYGFGALIDPLEDEFGWSRAAISAAFSLRTEVGGVAAPVVGYLTDRIGVRKVMVAGVIIVALGFAILSQVQELTLFYASMVVIAIGISGSSSAPAAVVIAHWFRRRRGLALGLLTFGGGLSGATVLILAGLIDWLGWRDALLLCGAAQLAVSLPLALSIRDKPEDMGLLADGSRASEDETAARNLEATGGFTTRQALRTPAFWLMSIAVGLGNFSTTALIVHIVPFLTGSIDMSTGSAALAATIMTTLTLIGRVGFGALSDAFPKHIIMAIAYGLIGVSMAMFATVHEVWQLAYTLPFFAIGFGGVIPARASIQVEYFGLKAFGSIQGLMLTISTVGAFAGPIVAGWMYDTSESYRLAFVILAISAAIAVPMLLLMRVPREPEAAAVA